MYISKVVLENFQAFEKGEFNLSPNLNILIGVSNVGKSSVARALSLVLFNQWDKSWCRFGAKFCRVTITTNTGIVVIREKGEKINRYILHLPNSPEQLFESFGTSVPEAVQNALKIHTVQVDTADTLNLNLAGQMDALFLLSQTGSYRAKVLGKLSGATYLDYAIRELNKDKRQVTAEKNSKDLEIVELQKEVDKFGAIESYSSVISELELKITSLTALEQHAECIRNLLERGKAIKDSWIRLKQKNEILGTLDLTAVDAVIKNVDKIKSLQNLFQWVLRLRSAYEKIGNNDELLKPLDFSGITVLSDRAARLKMLKDLNTRIVANATKLNSKYVELQDVARQQVNALKEYNDKLRENGVCPFCNNKFTADSCVQ